jgi:predicted permease
VIAIAATVAAAIAAGAGAERRWGPGAQAAARRVLDLMLWVLAPFVVFFNVARLEVTVDNSVGVVLAWVSLAAVGLAAWLVVARLLRRPRSVAGASIAAAVQANTGYFGLPLTIAALGASHVPEAAAYDALVQSPGLLLGVFAVGAAFGTRAGETIGERVRVFFTRNPILWAALLGLAAPDVLAPDLLVDVSRVLVVAQLPLGFFAVGVTLAAEAEEGALGLPPRVDAPVAVAVALRLVLAPALLTGLALPLIDLPSAYRLLSAMPCGIGALMAAHAYGLDLRVVASAVAWSTAIVVAVSLVAGF